MKINNLYLIALALSLALISTACKSAPEAKAETSSVEEGSASEPIAQADAPARECSWAINAGNVYHSDVSNETPHTLREVDLDGDGAPTDRIADLGMCGNTGECYFVVLRACEGGDYEAVWGPEYAQDLELVESGAEERWVLLQHSKTGQTRCDLPTQRLITRQHDAWESGAWCVSGVGEWEDEVCGEPPPMCPGAAELE